MNIKNSLEIIKKKMKNPKFIRIYNILDYLLELLFKMIGFKLLLLLGAVTVLFIDGYRDSQSVMFILTSKTYKGINFKMLIEVISIFILLMNEILNLINEKLFKKEVKPNLSH